jgi:SAM-dependent methyltransferase
MASINVIEWIQKYTKHIGSDVFEVGAKRYKEHSDLGLREFLAEKLPRSKLVGCDLSLGAGVDVLLDITAPLQVVRSTLRNKTFDSVFCVSVLEHIPDLFSACKNMSAILKPAGALFVSVPFVFRYHGYPGDLWRFTPEAVAYLFPDIDFLDYKHSTVTTLEQDDRMSLKGSNLEKMNRYLYRPRSREAKVARKEAKQTGETFESYSLAPSMINMLGFKR